ncbi:MAG: hypothetical protein V1744_02135 [Candidatus Altiarchaeota archaeon]
MKYIGLANKLRKNKQTIFSLADILNLYPDANRKTLKNNLTNWQSRGYIGKLRRGIYEDATSGKETPDLYIANRLYTPSYVSLETALSYYNIIPEVTAQVTSVTTKPTREYRNRHGLFTYRSCKETAYSGYHILRYEGEKVMMADREKTLIDYIYYKLRNEGTIDYDEERFDRRAVGKVDWKKMRAYAGLFNKKTTLEVERLRGWIEC